MCGIVGYWDKRGADELIVQRMAMRIQHCGPDDAGVWLDEDGDLALAHRRLSVIDLSPAGHQPMISARGRYVLVFNGEIYNHLALRAELEKDGISPVWRGHSDTETLLACIEAWSIERALKASVGMLAFALWDRHRRILTLARDRAGEKPLYYGWQRGALLFGSELKALTAHPSFHAQIDRGALALMLRHNCIPAPHSIYKGIQKLMPGHYVSIPSEARQKAEIPAVKSYWRPNGVVKAGLAAPFEGSDAEVSPAV